MPDVLPEPGYGEGDWTPHDFPGVVGRGWRLSEGDWSAYVYSPKDDDPASQGDWYWVINGQGVENYGVVGEAGYADDAEAAKVLVEDWLADVNAFGYHDQYDYDENSVSNDSHTVNFSQMTPEQQRELDEWDKIFKRSRHHVAMDKYRAMQIAGEWHGGQNTALYAFASSGKMLPSLDREVLETIEGNQGQPHVRELEMLFSWLQEAEGDENYESYSDFDLEQSDQYGSLEAFEWQSIVFDDAGVGFQAWSQDGRWVSQVYQSGSGDWTWNLHFRGELIADGAATSADQARNDAQSAYASELGMPGGGEWDSYYEQYTDPSSTSGDSQSVNFSQMTEEQNREMEEWDRIFKRTMRQIFAVQEWFPWQVVEDDLAKPYWKADLGDYVVWLEDTNAGIDYYWAITTPSSRVLYDGTLSAATLGWAQSYAEDIAKSKIDLEENLTESWGDSQSVNFTQMTPEQQHELDEWDKVFKTRRSLQEA